MKKITLAFATIIMLYTYNAFSQECIDLIILNSSANKDSIFCKIMAEDDIFVTIDNGISITSIAKSSIKTHVECYRMMTKDEIYLFKGINNLSNYNFEEKQTTGYYMRKGAFNMYLSSGLTIATVTFISIAAFSSSKKMKAAFYVTGGLCAAGSFLFSIFAWNNIYKAGKIIDINKKAALYLSPSDEGSLGLKISF